MRPKRVSEPGTNQHPVVLVTVAWYWSSLDAWMTRNRLADEGIDAFVLDEHVATTDWMYANAIGGIKVQVPQEQVERALDVFDNGKSDVFQLVPVAPLDENQPLCRRCGSPELYHEPYNVRVVFLLWFLFGILIPVPSSAVECYDCGDRDGPPTTYKLQFGVRHLLLLMFIVAVTLGIMRLTGHSWFESAAAPSRDWQR